MCFTTCLICALYIAGSVHVSLSKKFKSVVQEDTDFEPGALGTSQRIPYFFHDSHNFRSNHMFRNFHLLRVVMKR